jgi:hypothetical protein
VFGWDVKKHLLAMMPPEKRWIKQKMCLEWMWRRSSIFSRYILLQHVRTGRSWRDVMELSWTIETAYIFTQGGCQVSTSFKIVPAVITLH